MEPISKKSKLITSEDTSALALAPTVVSFDSYNDRIINPSVPPSDSLRSFTFDISASINSELHLNQCELVTEWKLVKEADGSAVAAGTQVGCINGFGLTGWQTCKVLINGQPYLPQFSTVDYDNYLQLLFGYSEIEQNTVLHALGWTQDTPRAFDSTEVELDPKCTCDCGKCPCATKDYSQVTANSMNCKPMTYDAISKLNDLTVAQIKANYALKAKLNKGLWLRARMLSKDRNVTTVTPLKLLHPFFRQKAFYPHRSNISINLTLKPDSQILIQKGGKDAATKHKLVIKSIYLILRYASFTEKLRSRWLGSVNQLGLRRTMQATKTAHFTVNKGKQNANFQSIFSYSSIPQGLLMFFQKESVHAGDYLNNRYCFKHNKLQTIKLFKSGIPLASNVTWVDMHLEKKYGYFHYYWYENMVKMFGKTALNVSLDSFFEDAYIFAFNLADNPRYSPDDVGFPRSPDKRRISLITAGSIDCQLEFSEVLGDNTVVFFVALYDLVSKFNVDGEPQSEDM